MPEFTYDNPWDEVIRRRYGAWTDELVSNWDGKSVSVTRTLDETTPEFMRVMFPDGSVLYLGIDSLPVLRRENPPDLGAAMDAAWGTDAYKVFGQWVKALYDQASAKQIDADIVEPPHDPLPDADPPF